MPDAHRDGSVAVTIPTWAEPLAVLRADAGDLGRLVYLPNRSRDRSERRIPWERFPDAPGLDVCMWEPES